MHGTKLIDICICTYQRSSAAQALQSVLEQTPVSHSIRINLIDNDQNSSAEDIAIRFAPAGVRYFHAPAQNISIARNTALDVADGTDIIFLDDDQIASPTWLAELLRRQEETDAEVVFGPVHAQYPNDAPLWALKGDFHSTRPSQIPGQEILTGYTGNVLIKRKTIGNLRFDVSLGRSGGEDTIFFHQLKSSGARFAFAESAAMTEPVLQHRLRFRWLARRAFRNGQTYARIVSEQRLRRFTYIPIATAKCIYCILSATVSIFSPVKWRRSALRGILHFGVVCSLSGLNDIRNY